MIDRWEILPDPNERFPSRCRINVSGNEEDIQPLLRRFPGKTGKPWMPRKGVFRLAFYVYELTSDERRLLERFLDGEKKAVEDVKASPRETASTDSETGTKERHPTAAAGSVTPSDAFSWDAAPDVEIILDAPKTKKSPASTQKRSDTEKASSAFVQSATDALMDWAGAPTAPAGSAAGERPTAAGERPPASPEAPSAPAPSFGQDPAARGEDSFDEQPLTTGPKEIIMSSGETGMPIEELNLAREPEPEVPAGFLYIRLAYVVPEDIASVGDKVHDLLVQTLESRRMPFVFHKVFTFPYRWPDRPLVDQVIEGCRRHAIDSLIGIGESRRLELLFEQCSEKGIKYHYLSREDSQKRYWRLGLITRIVVAEE